MGGTPGSSAFGQPGMVGGRVRPSRRPCFRDDAAPYRRPRPGASTPCQGPANPQKVFFRKTKGNGLTAPTGISIPPLTLRDAGRGAAERQQKPRSPLDRGQAERYTHQPASTEQPSRDGAWVFEIRIPSTNRFVGPRALSFLASGGDFVGWINFPSELESLILAQSERWRRA